MSQTLHEPEIVALVERAFMASQTSKSNANNVAKALTQAEIDGQAGHGLSRVASYTLQSRTGKVDGFATPSLSHVRDGAIVVDAASGFAYPAIELVLEALPSCAAKTGIAAAAIQRSHHCGVLGWHVERLAEFGLVALAFANTPSAMAPWGGTKRLFGTNPIAFAAPRKNASPVVVDLALSRVARGAVLRAAQRGEPIPADWATAPDGSPTTDPQKALHGSLMPIGDAKGAALAFMVEVLAVALTGANFGFEASSFFDEHGGPPNVGQFFVVVDPAGFVGAHRYFDRVGDLVNEIEHDAGSRLPGESRWARRRAAKDGVSVDDDLVNTIHAIADGSPPCHS
ncbi:MAG: Ldh family oxidoreductase [Hyphomicrobiaceae bacterium]